MPLANLSAEEKQVVFECLRAAAVGPFFQDWEFQTLFGIERSDVKEVVDAWPHLDGKSHNAFYAIIGSMNHLLGYPHGCDQEWSEYISVPPNEVYRILEKWMVSASDSAV